MVLYNTVWKSLSASAKSKLNETALNKVLNIGSHRKTKVYEIKPCESLEIEDTKYFAFCHYSIMYVFASVKESACKSIQFNPHLGV